MMFCFACGSPINTVDKFCPQCGMQLLNSSSRELSAKSNCQSDEIRLNPITCQVPAVQNTPLSFASFQLFKRQKESERQGRFMPQKKQKIQRPVQLQVGRLHTMNGVLQRVRGSTVMVEVLPNASADDILSKAVEKHLVCDRSLKHTKYRLLYPDGTPVVFIPGAEEPFVLEKYKAFLGKCYPKVLLFICSNDDFLAGEEQAAGSDSGTESPVLDVTMECAGSLSPNEETSSKSVPQCTSDSEGANTLKFTLTSPSGEVGIRVHQPLFVNHSQVPPSSSQTVTTVLPCTSGLGPLRNEPQSAYETYVDLLADSDTDSNEDVRAACRASLLDVSSATDNVGGARALEGLSQAICSDNVSQFNIARSHLWEGARRGFKRASYSPNAAMLVKFTDSIGINEDAIDLGGPRREFLQLVITYLATESPLFAGNTNAKHLTMSNTAMQYDDYYIAGVAMSVSLIHGGPAPRFLSPELYQALINGPDVTGVSVNSLPDSDTANYLKMLAQTTDFTEMNKLLDKLSTTLELAGTLCPLRSLSDRDKIVTSTAQWLCFGRTRPAFQRFQEGLTTLGVLAAARQHPDYFQQLFCYKAAQLTAQLVAASFVPELSELHSNKRQKEDRVLAWWLDYLQDVEDGQHNTKLENILQFSTGCSAFPPLGFNPCPTLEFQHDGEIGTSTGSTYHSRYPKAHTCTNKLLLPIVHDNFEAFVEDMNFGIINGHGFGFA